MEAITNGRMERIDGARLVELYTRHADGAYRLAYLLTGDRALAEDLTQEAFIRLVGRFLHLRNAGGFEAYLRRTVINLANSHFRRRRAEQASLERRAALREPEPTSLDLGDNDLMRRALLRLTPRQRAAVVLRFYEDLSEQQTSDLMRCSVGTVKTLTSRGMEALRHQLRGGTEA